MLKTALQIELICGKDTVKAVDLSDLSGFVVSSQQSDSVWIFGFQGEQPCEGF